MNILVGKLGKSIKFTSLTIGTGDDTPIIMYSTMSRMMPEHHFYFFGPNNLESLTGDEYNYLFPNNNVHSVYVKPDITGYQDNGEPLFSFEPLVRNIRESGIKFDFALLFVGFTGSQTLCNCCINQKTGKYCIPLNAFKRYAGPYVYALDCLQIPLYTIAEDPRYITINAKDLFNRERLVLTQMKDCDIKVYQKYIKSFEDQTFITNKYIKCTYAEVEKIFLMAIRKDWKEKIDIERKINNTTNPKCIVISNGHGTAGSKPNNGHVVQNARLPGYLEYVVNGLANTPYSNTHVYGKWTEEVTDKYSQFEDRKLADLSDEIADAKYSLVYSIIKGFVTIKPYELIVSGLIPFIHPDYDPDRLLNLPEYLYVKSPSDFASKMSELDADNDKYKQLLDDCFKCIKPEYLDGSHVINTVMHKIADDLGFEYSDHNGVEPIMDHFSKTIF